MGLLFGMQMWADSDRRLSERDCCSGRRSGSGNGRYFRSKHTAKRTGTAGFFLHLQQHQYWNRQDCVRRPGTHHSAHHSIRKQFKVRTKSSFSSFTVLPRPIQLCSCSKQGSLHRIKYLLLQVCDWCAAGFEAVGNHEILNRSRLQMRNLVVVVVVVSCSQENLVEIATLEVGNQTISVGLNASFDTLLFYTYLPSAVYTRFVNTVSPLLAAAAAAL